MWRTMAASRDSVVMATVAHRAGGWCCRHIDFGQAAGHPEAPDPPGTPTSCFVSDRACGRGWRRRVSRGMWAEAGASCTGGGRSRAEVGEGGPREAGGCGRKLAQVGVGRSEMGGGGRRPALACRGGRLAAGRRRLGRTRLVTAVGSARVGSVAWTTPACPRRLRPHAMGTAARGHGRLALLAPALAVALRPAVAGDCPIADTQARIEAILDEARRTSSPIVAKLERLLEQGEDNYAHARARAEGGDGSRDSPLRGAGTSRSSLWRAQRGGWGRCDVGGLRMCPSNSCGMRRLSFLMDFGGAHFLGLARTGCGSAPTAI